MLDIEQRVKREGFRWILGVDEAGRAPLAGPVVAAAVSLKQRSFHQKIADSKKLSPLQREKAFHEIYENAYVGVGIISETVIDRINILQATFAAMTNAVMDLVVQIPSAEKDDFGFDKSVCLLVDGNCFKSSLPYQARTVIRGDDSILSIACASIIAKVTRDRILQMYDRLFPQYGFGRHKGYPTKMHKQMLKTYGPTDFHRQSFRY